MTKQGNTFLKSDMFNLATFAVTVVPENICRVTGERDNFGWMALNKFVTTHMIELKPNNFVILKRKTIAPTLDTLELL